MIFRQIFTPELSIYSYLIGDEVSRRAIVIDPVRHVETYLEAAEEDGIEIVAIAETHVHADFISGSVELKSRLAGKPLIYASKMGGPTWTPHYADCQVADGDTISLGDLFLTAKHTPGHTPEHLIWLCYLRQESPSLIFTGDLLFVGGVGRPDLLGKEGSQILSKQLYHSLFQVVGELPDAVEIFPAHGAGSLCGKAVSSQPTSTLGYERQFNPSLQSLPENRWVAKLLHQMPAAPQHFQKIKSINIVGPALLAERQPVVELAEIPENSFIIDTRDPLHFAAGHFPHAVNIPHGANFCNWSSMLVPEELPIVLALSSTSMARQIEKLLLLIGFDRVVGYIKADLSPLQENLILLTPLQLANKKNMSIIDVRSAAEWSAGHIEGAHHRELATFAQVLPTLPRDSSVALICGSGYRSSLAASWLKRAGFSQVASVWGGMQGWREAGLPIVISND